MTDSQISAAAVSFLEGFNAQPCPKTNLGKIALPLAEDVIASLKLNTLTGNRATIRALFAFIEGFIFALKRLLIRQAKYKKIKLSEAEQLVLKERAAKIQNDEAQSENLRLSLAANIKFTFKKVNILFDVTPPITYGQQWQALLRLKKVRDRLTHPKNEEDLIVSEKELADGGQVFHWFLTHVNNVIKAYEVTETSLCTIDRILLTGSESK